MTQKFPNALGKKAVTALCVSLLVSTSYSAFAANTGSANGSSVPLVQKDMYNMAETFETTVPLAYRSVSVESSEQAGSMSKQTAELNARLQLETGHIYNATKTLDALNPVSSHDAQLMGQTANAENYGGNWPYASYLLTQAHNVSPENQDVTALQNEIRRLHAPNVEADFDWIKYGHSLEDVSALSGYVNATDHMQLGAVIKDNYIMGRNIRRIDGRIEDTNTNKQQGEAYAQYSAHYGQIVKASVFGNNDSAGGGLYYNFLNPLGETQLTGEFQRPYWDIPEGVIDDANRDRIAFFHVIRPTAHLTVEGGAGWNRYNVAGVQDVLNTISADFNTIYRLVDGVKYHKPYIDIGYNIDGEYDKSGKTGLDADGNTNLILPQHSREIHTPFVEVGGDINPSTYGDVAAGWQFDRLGGNGPLVEGKITHEITPVWDVQLRASYGLETANSENTITTVGGYLRCRF